MMPSTILVSSRYIAVIWQTCQGAGRSHPCQTAAVSNLMAILETHMAVVNNVEALRPATTFGFECLPTETLEFAM